MAETYASEDAQGTQLPAARRESEEEGGEDSAARFLRLKRRVIDDLRHGNEWRREARACYDMVAGRQWDQSEETALEEQGKVPIKFNRVLSIVKSVAGHEINNRHEVKFFPRGTEDTAANDTLNAASQWMADNCDAEDEESDAFEDLAVCGMGWTEHVVEYDVEPEGAYREVRVDPLEMAWDASAKRKNLADARRLHRVRRDVDPEEAKRMFPGFAEESIDARWVLSEADAEEPVPVEERRKHESGIERESIENRNVTVVETQWYEMEPYYLVAAAGDGETVDMSVEQFRSFEERAKEIGFDYRSVRLNRRIYKRAFLGAAGILEEAESPAGTSWTYTCMTGERDRNKGLWFGLVSVMRDPQKFANKWLTNTLHLLNVNAKGGVFAEKDAFEDQRQAEDSYARPQTITWLKDGALSGPAPKLKEKPTAQFPAGYFNLMEFAISSIRDTAGVNLELLGMTDRDQPGILEAQRKQAAVTILATLFNALRRFRKAVGRIRLYYIQNYLSDGRLIRVTGPTGAKAVPLLRDETLGQYDVIVDESASGISQKAETWNMIQEILPAVRDMITPQLFFALLKYSPLPASLLTELEQIFEQSQGDPQAEERQKLAMQQIIAEIAKDRASAQRDQAEAGKTQAETQQTVADTAKTIAETRQIGSLTDPKVQELLRMAAEAGVIGQEQQ